ncbi:HGGxSTG domain-containing protein [Kingella sp. (in: b-proteobacteria)]|uniref:HGGxSTG domain-containing protein n=1 Tax=Kingella sp. (in: b-proteobacteria) TaxID=2020713 RepID=UPI0026DA90D7|nr:HGGxSTG domain-containing protein [Kingella sp. (in: b-proteobacteria)]MDO4657915.1 HGGxSTG domain-containing protein [Kingella sp. (in: b-proteobacteria)]
MADICGAKTRAGKPCQNVAMANGRCRMHGGKSTGAPKGNTNKVSAGALYSHYYTDTEKLLADELELESIDAELRLCKIRLNRALKLEAEQEGLELERIVETPALVGGVPITDDPDVPPVQQKTFVRKDYEPIIQRLLGRIESLTLTRQKLINGMKLDITSSDGSLMPTVIELVAAGDDESTG